MNTKHPTPVEIEIAILEAIVADKAASADDESLLNIPIRVGALVRKGIQNACEAVK